MPASPSDGHTRKDASANTVVDEDIVNETASKLSGEYHAAALVRSLESDKSISSQAVQDVLAAFVKHKQKVTRESKARTGGDSVVVTKSQRAALKTAGRFMSCGMFVAGIVLAIVLLTWVNAVTPEGDLLLEPDSPPPSFHINSTASNCTAEPAVISELLRTEIVATFFNATCIAANGTGDPCHVHDAEMYTQRMFSVLELYSLFAIYVSFNISFSLSMLGGIPRPTDWNGALFFGAWMATQFATFATNIIALVFEVCAFLSVRARLYPCLITVDGMPLLDFYAMTTFAVQPNLVIRAALAFSSAYLVGLGLLVLDGAREWTGIVKCKSRCIKWCTKQTLKGVTAPGPALAPATAMPAAGTPGTPSAAAHADPTLIPAPTPADVDVDKASVARTNASALTAAPTPAEAPADGATMSKSMTQVCKDSVVAKSVASIQKSHE